MTERRLAVEELPAEFHIENYSLQEILSFLHSMNLMIDEEDLTKPTCARITLLFECILYLFSPWRAEMIDEQRTNSHNEMQPHFGSVTYACSLLCLINVFTNYI
jgi:hypothetical protein